MAMVVLARKSQSGREFADKCHLVSGSGIDYLLDDFVRIISSVPFCTAYFGYTILSNNLCPYHFVRSHFVLEPPSSHRQLKGVFYFEVML